MNLRRLLLLSGPLGSAGALPSVNSTEEAMLVVFQTDGGNNARGFHAHWTPQLTFDKIDGEVFLTVLFCKCYLRTY